MLIIIVALLVLTALLLFIVELFLIPGISIAGIAATLSMAASVYLAYAQIGVVAGHITLFANIIIIALAIYFFLKSKTLDKMALKTNIDNKIDLIQNNLQVGQHATTLSRLAPMGKILIDGKQFEARSQGEFIPENTAVIITAIDGNIATVKEI